MSRMVVRAGDGRLIGGRRTARYWVVLVLTVGLCAGCSSVTASPEASQGARIDDESIHQAVRTVGAGGFHTPWIMAAITSSFGEVTRVDPTPGPGGDLYGFELNVEVRLTASVQPTSEFDGNKPVLTTRCYRLHWKIGPTSSMAEWDGTTSTASCPAPATSPDATATALAQRVRWLVSASGGGNASVDTLRAGLARSLPGARIEVVTDPPPPHYDHPPLGAIGVAVLSGSNCIYATAEIDPGHPLVAADVDAWVAVPADEVSGRFGCHAQDAVIGAAEAHVALSAPESYREAPYQGP